LIDAIGNLEHEPPYPFCPIRAYDSNARCEKRTTVSEFFAYTREMKWLEQTLAQQAQVIAHLHSQSDSQSDSQLNGADLALVCSDLELIAWNGQSEQRLLLRAVKKFSREGLDLLVFDANGEALRLPILSAPRTEIDAFFAALKPAIARARVAQPIAPKMVEAAPIASSEFKLELSPEPVQVPQVVSQAKTGVLEPEKEMSFDLGPLLAPASTPAPPVPTAIVEPAPTGEMVFDLGALIAPVIAPKPIPVPQPKVESVPVLEPEPAVVNPVIVDQTVADQAAQAWPEVFGSIAPPEPVQVASTPVQPVTEAKLQPMAEIRPVTVSESTPTSSPQQVQASVSSTPAASSSPMAEAEIIVPVGRGQANSESKKPEAFDPLLAAPKPKRELPPRVQAQDFGNGLFMHEKGFKYQLASIGERSLAMLVDSFLMGIVNRVLTAMTLSSVNAHVARLQEILILDASTTDPTKSAALTLERETLMRNVPGEMLQAILLSAFLTLIVTWLYYAFFESGPKQATPGKIVMKIGVTDLNIARVSFLQATRRFAWRIGPFYVLLMIALVTLGSQLYSGSGDAIAAAFSLMIWVAVAMLLLFGGLLAAAFTKRRQTAHDLLAQTLVVKA
jgi:uncharacterized RDD family membrane protein YckC